MLLQRLLCNRHSGYIPGTAVCGSWNIPWIFSNLNLNRRFVTRMSHAAKDRGKTAEDAKDRGRPGKTAEGKSSEVLGRDDFRLTNPVQGSILVSLNASYAILIMSRKLYVASAASFF